MTKHTLHIHWDQSGSDCDGPLDRYRVSAPGGWGDTADEVLRTIVASFHHPCEEWNGAPRLGSWCDEYEHRRSLTVLPITDPAMPTCPRCGGSWGFDITCVDCTDEEGNPRPIAAAQDDPWPTVTVTGWIIETSAPHEEGGSYERIEVCENERCDVGTSSQRDYYAESMGY